MQSYYFELTHFLDSLDSRPAWSLEITSLTSRTAKLKGEIWKISSSIQSVPLRNHVRISKSMKQNALGICRNWRKSWGASLESCFMLYAFYKLFIDHFLLHVLGFYGQLQTFCPPHYPDTQKNVQHNVSCSMVPPFEDCLLPTSVGQAGLGVFHRTFSAHSGITGKCQLGTF